MRLTWGAKSAAPVRLAGHQHHASALGELVTSLYAAGRPEYRDGPDDPAPGVPSITAVMEQLKLKNLDQVVEVRAAEGWAIAQGRCRLDSVLAFLAAQGLALAPGTRGPERRSPKPAPLTAGAAVINGKVSAVWVDALAKDGLLTRRDQADLPPDALVVAAALRVRLR
ncbi:MAG: hypothetical protein LBK95_06655 [Bifidobacteriaceae bacterium]|jgi:hypothetical protein|nr:hypothetical protein [Bifidobacteriaceae bacterium]